MKDLIKILFFTIVCFYCCNYGIFSDISLLHQYAECGNTFSLCTKNATNDFFDPNHSPGHSSFERQIQIGRQDSGFFIDESFEILNEALNWRNLIEFNTGNLNTFVPQEGIGNEDLWEYEEEFISSLENDEEEN